MQVNHPEAERFKELCGGAWCAKLDNDDIIVIVPLMFHVGVYVNPGEIGGADERYCMSNGDIAIKAIEEYERTGEFNYYQKWHNKNISVVGTVAYKNGTHTLDNKVFDVKWNACELKREYPYGGPHASIG